MTDTQTTVDDIKAGHHDGHLGDLLTALFDRAVETETVMGWRITWADHEWTRNTVSLGELAVAERLTGKSYLFLDPVRSADHLAALIAARLHKVDGLTLAQAVNLAGSRTAGDLDGVISVVAEG